MVHEFLRDILISKKRSIAGINIGEEPEDVNIGSFSANIDPGRINVIAEIKKASPSRGIINSDLDVTEAASVYNRFPGFISGLSVLTEELYFKGQGSDIGRVKKGTGLPVLRKDFIFNKKQVYESAVLGADCILLIKSLLGYSKLERLYGFARELGLDVLIEVHSKEELMQVLELDAELIGINNRDLKKMKVDSGHIISVLSDIPSGWMEGRKVICESGVDGIPYMEKVFNMGINTFLIGTHFMASPHLEDELAGLEEGLRQRGLIK